MRFDIQFPLQDFLSKLYFLPYKSLRDIPRKKVTCRSLRAGDKLLGTHNFSIMDNKGRSFRIEIRLTEDEYKNIHHNAIEYNSISQYIRMAIKEYGSSDIKKRLDAMNTLTSHYEQYHNVLFHAAANLNQTVKRANELQQAGLLTPSYLQMSVMPQVQQTTTAIMDIRKMLQSVINKLI